MSPELIRLARIYGEEFEYCHWAYSNYDEYYYDNLSNRELLLIPSYCDFIVGLQRELQTTQPDSDAELLTELRRNNRTPDLIFNNEILRRGFDSIAIEIADTAETWQIERRTKLAGDIATALSWLDDSLNINREWILSLNPDELYTTEKHKEQWLVGFLGLPQAVFSTKPDNNELADFFIRTPGKCIDFITAELSACDKPQGRLIALMVVALIKGGYMKTLQGDKTRLHTALRAHFGDKVSSSKGAVVDYITPYFDSNSSSTKRLQDSEIEVITDKLNKFCSA